MALSYNVLRFDSLDSTNTYAKMLADGDAPEGTVVVAGMQTAGHGKYDRMFFSPKGVGLYMSVILRPQIRAEQALLITTAAAVATAQAIEELVGEAVAIKWVNDIYYRDKKVCGILTEGRFEGDKLRYAVLGIGVNVAKSPEGFPPELAQVADALFDTADTVLCERLQTRILENFNRYYVALTDKAFLPEYRSRSYLTGKTVQVIAPDGIPGETVTVIGIADDFALIVTNGEETKHLTFGEVSIRL